MRCLRAVWLASGESQRRVLFRNVARPACTRPEEARYRSPFTLRLPVVGMVVSMVSLASLAGLSETSQALHLSCANGTASARPPTARASRRRTRGLKHSASSRLLGAICQYVMDI